MKTKTNYNPDVLSCLANLSNDEVFTPPALANQMLDALPSELWKDKNAKFLDPVSKSGVFLREIARRLIEGLEDQIPDPQERINHIYKNQLYGIAITELTSLLSRRSLYCSKSANGKYSIGSVFENEQGNIIFNRIEHIWEAGKCVFCSANQTEYDRGDILETHAYQFIHTEEPSTLFNMKFDVIIGNPPYQLSTGGSGVQAIPLYDKFVLQAKKLNPRYLTMIIPARWYSGGFGLDRFRDEMLSDKRIRHIVDYPEATDAFSGVQIKGGVCYFVWDRDNPGKVKVSTFRKDKIVSSEERNLVEDGAETFIRYNEAVGILQKISKKSGGAKTMDTMVSAQKPFGLPTTFRGVKNKKEGMLKVYENGGTSFVRQEAITANKDLISRHKVYIPAAGSGSDRFPHPILGKPFAGEKDSVCTETYVAIGPFASLKECSNAISYIRTRFFRFLVMLKKPTQHALRKVYSLVPVQDFKEEWTDEKLYKKYNITKDEIAFIESLIRPM